MCVCVCVGGGVGGVIIRHIPDHATFRGKGVNWDKLVGFSLFGLM